jgi:PAS domain S-box-containing protein
MSGDTFEAWAALVDRTNDLLCTANADGYLEQLNPAWTRVLGWSLEELRSRPYVEFIHPDDLDATLAQASAIVDPAGWFPSFENRYRTRDGEYRSLLWSASTDGTTFYALAKDITDRRADDDRAERALARLAEAQSVARIGSWEWEPDTGRLEWSDELYRLYGEEPGRIDPSYEWFLARVHPDDRDELVAAIEAAIADGEPYELHHRVVLTSGAVRTMLARGRAVRREDGSVSKLSGTGQDVTEQVAMSQALQDTTARLAEQELSRRRAIDLNDDVVQQLVLALLDLRRGEVSTLETRLAGTLERAREIVDDLLPDGETVTPGDLRRSERGT